MERSRQRIIASIDVPTKAEARRLIQLLSEDVQWFKIGLELLTAAGPAIITEVSRRGGNVFLDGKFHDIPNTVQGAARAAVRMGASMFNVHATGGTAMMRAAAEAAAQEASRLGISRPLILGVTVLTSIDQRVMNKELKVSGPVGSYVVHLAKLAHGAGLDGVVASPQEIILIRAALPPDFLIVTPGVRPQWASRDDQRRAATPAEAIASGATHLVIGRPITRPPKSMDGPRAAVSLIIKEIEETTSRAGEQDT